MALYEDHILNQFRQMILLRAELNGDMIIYFIELKYLP